MEEQTPPMYDRLLELLHKLPQDAQDKVTELAKADADCFCKKYKDTISDGTELTALHYYLSKRVRFAWFNGVSFEHADPIDIVDLGKIYEYYKERLEWLLDYDIQSKAPFKSELLKEELIPPLHVIVI